MHKSFNPTPKQKKLALDHFLYRVRQLIDASSHPGVSSYPKVADKTVHNALVESTLIHSRALNDFFGRESRYRDKKSEKDDVLVTDYGFSPSQVGINEDYVMRLHKDLAHFTYSERVTYEQKYWEYEHLVQPILLRSRQFIEHLLQNYQALTSDQASECKQRLEQIDEWMKHAMNEK